MVWVVWSTFFFIYFFLFLIFLKFSLGLAVVFCLVLGHFTIDGYVRIMIVI